MNKLTVIVVLLSSFSVVFYAHHDLRLVSDIFSSFTIETEDAEETELASVSPEQKIVFRLFKKNRQKALSSANQKRRIAYRAQAPHVIVFSYHSV